MALTGPMDITFNDNMQSIIKDLPVELKNIVLSYIDIRKFVSYNDANIDPFIDAYIKHYIEARLFSDASMFAFFMEAHQNSHLHANYGKTIEEKIYKMATVWAEDFIEQCELLNENPVDNPHVGVCFNIKYNFRSKMYDTLSTNPLETSIEYFQNPNNRFTIVSDSIDRIYYDKGKSKFLVSNIVISEMVSSICHFMTRADSGVSQIHSIELVKLYRSPTMDDDGQILKKYRSSNMDYGYADGQIIKKYY
jgi:hypothetical protein